MQAIDPISLAYEAMEFKGFSEDKAALYLHHIKEFVFTIEKSMDELTEKDLKAYFQNLLTKNQLSYKTMDAVNFFFREAAGRYVF